MIENNSVSKIKVLHPITRLIVGGAQENTLFTAERLPKNFFKVDVLSGIQTGSEGSLIEEAYQRQISLLLVPELLREISPLNDWKAYKKIKSIIREGKYSIIHTHSSKAGILGRIAALHASTPIIIHTVHGWSFHEQMSPLKRFFYISLEKWIAQFTDAMVFVSKNDMQKGIKYKIGAPNHYHLIRSAIPLDDFNPVKYNRNKIRQELGLPTDAIVVGNIGRLSVQKNPLTWIRIAQKISTQIPTCLFLLVGDGPLKSKVLSEIRELGLEDKFVLTGIRRDIPRILACIDIFLLTSLWEGLPRVIPQAFAMGIPVVANRVDGISDVIIPESTGFIHNPGENDKLAEDCIRLILDDNLRYLLGQNGKKMAEDEFNLENMVSSLEQLYLNLLSK